MKNNLSTKKFVTPVCDTTIGVFENILEEVKIMRGKDDIRIKMLIEKRLNQYQQKYNTFPDKIYLGTKEIKYFTNIFQYVTPQGGMSNIPIIQVDLPSNITMTKPNEQQG